MKKFLKHKQTVCSNNHIDHSLNMDSDDDPDVSIVKVVKPQKTPVKWVTPTFDDFGSDFMPMSQPKSNKLISSVSKSRVPSASQPVNRKRPREDRQLLRQLNNKPRFKQAVSMELWVEKHHPNSKVDLAVHKKKVEEIETWITKARDNEKMCKMVLLTGPAGAGKTATVKVLCDELKLQLQEWSNPVHQSSQQFTTSSQDYWEQSQVDINVSGSQQSQFENFLLRANKYQCLDMDGGGSDNINGKLILIEEFPNIYLRDSTLFHNLLRRYQRVGRSLLVFIVSDSSRGDSKERQLFPTDLQQELSIHNISFNPVAPTMMVKVLNRISSQEKTVTESCPSLAVIESIAMSSTGDIRSAINALQFACRQDTFDLNSTVKTQKPKKTGKTPGSRLKYESSKKESGKKSTGEELGGIGARDTSCFLFHAIGKILYCKRGDPSTYTDIPRLPSHLLHHDRDPMLLNPEDVVEKSQVSGDYFASFLHQNYVDFYNNIDDVVNASEYLSLVDSFSSQWSTKTALENYATSLASRSLIYCNTSISRFDSPRTGVGWKPLHKSQWFTVQRQSRKNLDVACSLFRGYHWEPEVLWTEILPYLNRINVTVRNPAQITFLQEMGRFCQRSNFNRGEKLSEHDVVGTEDIDTQPLPAILNTDQLTGDMIHNSQSEVQNNPLEEEEEEYEIDEYFD